MTNTLEMTNYDEIYKNLRKEFSDAEIVEGYVFPDDMDEAEIAVVEEEFRALRMKALREQTEEQRLLSALMRMKLLMQDYFERGGYEPAFSFSLQLEQYLKLLGRSQRAFADEIGLHPTKLSRLLHDRENPNVELAYRLETHSGNIIPAVYWWKLHAKRIEEAIKTDLARKKLEGGKVRNPLKFSA